MLSRHAFRVAANQTRRRLPGAIGPGARRARARAAELLREHGGGPLATSALRPENRVFVTPDGGHAVAYQQHAGVALALGEPIGDPDGAAAAVAAFATAAEQEGLTPAVFATRDARVVPEGWRVSPLGRDLVLDLGGADAPEPAGPEDAAGATDADPTTSILLPARDLPWELRSQIRALSSVWVSDRHVPELGLTVGSSIDAPDGDDHDLPGAARVSVVTDAAGAVLAAVSWLPIPGLGGTVRGWALDAVRRALPKDDGDTAAGAGAGTASGEHTSRAVERALTDACRSFASEGASLVSFAASGLAQDGTEPDGVAVRTMAGIAHRVDQLYRFTEIANVAERLGATAAPLFLACREDADQPRVAYAAAAGFLTGIRLRDLPGLSGSLLVR
jgi:lysylphosphatidylglycerol synthetase-like protein (DUF2156 family)